MKNLSVIFPVHNGARFLRKNLEELVEVLSQLTNQFQVIIVDDASVDGSDYIAMELEKEYPQVTAVFHVVRQGEMTAIESGRQRARYELTFVQAEARIEESKIHSYLHRHQRSHVDPEPAAREPNDQFPEPVEFIVPTKQTTADVDELDISTARPTSNEKEVPVELSAISDRELVLDEHKHQQLVRRLMEWGLALRKFRNLSETDQTDAELKELFRRESTTADLPPNQAIPSDDQSHSQEPEPRRDQSEFEEGKKAFRNYVEDNRKQAVDEELTFDPVLQDTPVAVADWTEDSLDEPMDEVTNLLVSKTDSVSESAVHLNNQNESKLQPKDGYLEPETKQPHQIEGLLSPEVLVDFDALQRDLHELKVSETKNSGPVVEPPNYSSIPEQRLLRWHKRDRAWFAASSK